MPDSRTISIGEAAQLLGLCGLTVYKAAERGDIPTIRIGRRILVLREPFERMLQGEEATPILK